MAIQRSLNIAGSGSHWLLYNLGTVALAAGWTCPRSGSGVSGVFGTQWVFNSVVTGNGIVRTGDPPPPILPPPPNNVGVGVGSEAAFDDGAWFVLEDPGGGAQYCYQRGGARGSSFDGYWGAWYSAGGLFTGGSAFQRATATDEVELRAIGSVFTPGGTATLVHVAADDTASPDGAYGFVAVELTAGNVTSGAIWADDLRAQVGAGDPAPIAAGFYGEPLTRATMSIATETEKSARVDVGGSGESGQPVGYAWPATSAAWYGDPIGAGASLYDSEERPIPLQVADQNIGGFLGESRWFQAPQEAHGYPNTGSSLAYLFLDSVLINDLWDGSTAVSSI